jgi:predicted transcriptional regulator
MQPITLSPSRQAELEQFAQENGQTPAEVVENALAAYIGGEVDEYDDDLQDSLAAIDEALAEVEAGETISLEDFKREIRRDYGL